MPDELWFLRKAGKVTGPFNRIQLEGLRRRGQLSQFHEASQDKQNWANATAIPGLFPDAGGQYGQGGGQAANPEAGGYAPQADSGGYAAYASPSPPRQEWHYDDGTSEIGPVGADQIIALIAASRVNVNSRVWRDGLPAWILLGEAPEFAPYLAKSASGGGVPLDGLGLTLGEYSPKPARSLFANPMVLGLAGLGLFIIVGLTVAIVAQQKGLDFLSSLTKNAIINSHKRDDIRKAVGLVVWGTVATNLKTGLLREVPAFRGSCFQVSPDGYLLTNKHVVESYEEYMRAEATLKEKANEGVKLEPKLWVFLDNEKYDAKVIHTSGKFDLAVLKINYEGTKERPYFRIKETQDIIQSTQVYALGFPAAISMALNLNHEAKTTTTQYSEHVESALQEADFRYSITDGIINLVSNKDKIEYIIHGAQISGGNSGGPLIGQDGLVYGINTLGTGVKETTGDVKHYYAVSFPQMMGELRKKVPKIFE